MLCPGGVLLGGDSPANTLATRVVAPALTAHIGCVGLSVAKPKMLDCDAIPYVAVMQYPLSFRWTNVDPVGSNVCAYLAVAATKATDVAVAVRPCWSGPQNTTALTSDGVLFERPLKMDQFSFS
jgi:hypothetical protein